MKMVELDINYGSIALGSIVKYLLTAGEFKRLSFYLFFLLFAGAADNSVTLILLLLLSLVSFTVVVIDSFCRFNGRSESNSCFEIFLQNINQFIE